MSNMRISPLFKRLGRKLRLKKKEPSQEQDEQNAFYSSPTVETALAPGHHFATNHHPSQQTSISTQQTTAQQTSISSQQTTAQQTTISSQQTTAQQTTISSQQTTAQQTTAQQTTKPPRNKPPHNKPPSPRNQLPPHNPKPNSGSVTLAERVNYQKVVLGMSDAQIASTLPPGEYTIVSPPSMPPSGPGHLAYAYRC
jgi:hypothetical protein